MKKTLLIAVAAFLVSGIAFAQDSTQTKKSCNNKECSKEKKKCMKDCCKGKECKKPIVIKKLQ